MVNQPGKDGRSAGDSQDETSVAANMVLIQPQPNNTLHITAPKQTWTRSTSEVNQQILDLTIVDRLGKDGQPAGDSQDESPENRARPTEETPKTPPEREHMGMAAAARYARAT